MFKRILVPLDGSTLAETALRPALALAKRFDGELLIVRAVLAHVFPGADPGPAQLKAFQEAQAYLEAIRSRLQAEGVPFRTAIPYDSPAEGIADQAEFRKVDLIVMTTHGRTGLDGLLHPSVTWNVLALTHAPILAWKRADAADDASLPRFMIEPAAPILVPLDGSALAESALPVAQELAHLFGNPLVLVRAAERPYIASGVMDYPGILARAADWAVEETNSYLKRKELELKSFGERVAVESGLATAAWFIEDVAQARRAGLVVMASHGRSGLGRFLLGSVAKSVLSQTEAPVLVVRARQTETE